MVKSKKRQEAKWCLYYADSLQGPDEERLIEYLLTNNSYQPLSRPVRSEDMAVEVVFGLSLQQIVGVVSTLVTATTHGHILHGVMSI